MDDFKSLSLFHYLNVIRFRQKNSVTLNNIGVLYEQLHMLAKSIEYYQMSFEQEETLAAANIAYRYINAGFLDDAKRILDKAKKPETVHANVGSAMAAIDKKETAESKLEEESINLAHEQQRYLSRFGEAYFVAQEAPVNFTGRWKVKEGVDVIVTQSDEKMEAKWETAEKKYTLVGMVTNRAFNITSYREKLSNPNLFSLDKTSDTGYGYITMDGDQLQIMLLLDSQYIFMTWTTSLVV
jgi:tetratricopeptide (TPR) repeat protein